LLDIPYGGPQRCGLSCTDQHDGQLGCAAAFFLGSGKFVFGGCACCPCTIFVSSKDHRLPSERQETHIVVSHGGSQIDFDAVKLEDFENFPDLSIVVFRGEDHGGWMKRPFATSPKIVKSICVLTEHAEELIMVKSMCRKTQKPGVITSTWKTLLTGVVRSVCNATKLKGVRNNIYNLEGAK
jgi:hypothetical protein